MDAMEALLRLGSQCIDEVAVWHRIKQSTAHGSTSYLRADGAIDALNVMADRIHVMLQVIAQKDRENFFSEDDFQPAGGLRIITGGKS